MKFNAIKTKYKGMEFKSRYEANIAMLLDKMGWCWDYEPESFLLEKGHYMPDFKCTHPNGRITYVEVRGYSGKDWQLVGFVQKLPKNSEFLVFRDTYMMYTDSRGGYIVSTAAAMHSNIDGTAYQITLLPTVRSVHDLAKTIEERSKNRWMFLFGCENGNVFTMKGGNGDEKIGVCDMKFTELEP